MSNECPLLNTVNALVITSYCNNDVMNLGALRSEIDH